MSRPQRLRDVLAEDPLLLTPEEAARLLRVGRTTVYALMKAGDLHPIHIGRSCRLSRAELERFVGRLESPEPDNVRRQRRCRRPRTDQSSLFELSFESVDEAEAVHRKPSDVRAAAHTSPRPRRSNAGVSNDGRR
jgi:excisionase family DNA binding protein